MNESGLKQTGMDSANPFQPKSVIQRTLYQDKLSNQQQDQEYFPWGKGRGGAGDPFKDEYGNVITNRKAAIQYQRDRQRQNKFQESTFNNQYQLVQQQNPNVSNQQPYYQMNRITREDPSIVEHRRQMQLKYYEDLQLQIKEANKIKEIQQIQDRKRYGSPMRSQPPSKFEIDYSSQASNPYRDLLPVHYPTNTILYSKLNSQIDHEINKLRLEMSNQTKHFSQQLQDLKHVSQMMYYENQDQKSYVDDLRIQQLPKRIAQITEVDLGGNRSISNPPKPRNNQSFLTVGQTILNSNFSNRQFSKPVDTLPIHSSLHPVQYTNFNDKEYDFSRELEKDQSFNVLNEIQQLNLKSEQENSNYISQTAMREKKEKFVQELDFNRNFPQVEKYLRMEESKKQAKDQLGRSLGKTINPKGDLVYELLEQSIVSNELYTARKNLNEFTYRAQNPSSLVKLQEADNYDSLKQNIIPGLELQQVNPKSQRTSKNDLMQIQEKERFDNSYNQSAISKNNDSMKQDRTMNSQFQQVVMLMNQNEDGYRIPQDGEAPVLDPVLDVNQSFEQKKREKQEEFVLPKDEEEPARKSSKLEQEHPRQSLKKSDFELPKDDENIVIKSQEQQKVDENKQSQNKGDYMLPMDDIVVVKKSQDYKYEPKVEENRNRGNEGYSLPMDDEEPGVKLQGSYESGPKLVEKQQNQNRYDSQPSNLARQSQNQSEKENVPVRKSQASTKSQPKKPEERPSVKQAENQGGSLSNNLQVFKEEDNDGDIIDHYE